MNLQLKPDFPQALARFEAWWHCELIDRPLLTVPIKPHKPPREIPARHATLRERWMDMEYQIDCARAWMESQTYIAETLPIWFPNVGPDLCATLFGSGLEFGEETSWSTPVAASCRDVLALEPNFDTEYWQTIARGMELSLAAGRGKWLTGLPDLHTGGDLLAALRGPQGLCLELLDDPDAVGRAMRHLGGFYGRMYDDVYNRLCAVGQPATTWAPCLHAGKSYVSSCDFICMISPEMFQTIFLPAIAVENRHLERSIFHLDGPGALKHLDALLEDGRVDGLQWVYGAGNGPSQRWIDVYKKAQAAGKCLQIACWDFADAQAVMEHLRPEGVWLCIDRQYEPAEAQAFLNQL